MTKLILVSVLALVSAVSAQFSAAEQKQILDAFNAFRSEIAMGYHRVGDVYMPPAKNMRNVKWSESLAESARHEITPDCGWPYGHAENIYVTSNFGCGPLTIDGTGIRAANIWLKEYAENNWTGTEMNATAMETPIHNAVRMSWAKVETVGCGAIFCSDNKTVKVVCQTDPITNMVNHDIYESGTTCSACPSGTTCETDTGLCV